MPHILGQTDDVDEGMQYVSAELAANRPGFFVGRGPAGFALVVGAHKAFESSGGRILGLSLTPVQLAKLRDRCVELLHGQNAKVKL